MTKKVFPAALAAVLALTTACGGAMATRNEGSREASEGPVDPYGDPRPSDRDPFAGYLAITSLEVPAAADTAGEAAGTASAGDWAIQVAACSSESAAARLGELASGDTGLDFVVDREGQWWKVRVGSFATREAAGVALEGVKSSGYDDAWIVERTAGD